MMIRALTVSLIFAALAAPAYAQDAGQVSTPPSNPDTRQTDDAEDDYRRSQRRRDTGDIFDDIDINTGSTGSGGMLGREIKAIDRLDPESRRHLNKQRAKALAEAAPGEPIDAAYEPSDAAQTDEYIERQEAEAWKEMVDEANGGLSGTVGQDGAKGGKQSGQGQASGDAGQSSGQGQAGQAGAGQSGESGDTQTRPSTSPLRGGSASSASSILDRIKGRGGQSAQSGTTPSQSGEQAGGPAAQSQPSDSSSQGQAPAGQSDTQADAQSASDSAAKAAADTQSQARANAQAAAEANAPNAAAEAAAHRETMSPLERLKRDPVERNDVGGRTSASDYLNRKKD